MGLFDSLYFSCPKCGERLEEQTKSGPCGLESYNIEDELPEWLLLDLDNTKGRCYKCNAPYKLDFGVKVIVTKKHVRQLSAVEEYEWFKEQDDY